MLKESRRLKLLALCMGIIFLPACSSRHAEYTEPKINNKVYFEDKNLEGMSKSDVKRLLENYSKKVEVAPKNAIFDQEKWKVVPEKNGKKLNIDKTLNAIFNSREDKKVPPIIEEVKPDITSDTIENSIVEISNFSTEILDDQESRVNNIELAANYIDNVKLMPKEEFSFNGTLGKRTRNKGYEKAPIIIRTEEGPKKGYGVGGGICQIATTLYNAALNADMKITERHGHSKSIGYVEKGKDATVVYGGADLKFVNNRTNPVVIKASVKGGKVTVKLYEVKNTNVL